jgi:hypothetical protein
MTSHVKKLLKERSDVSRDLDLIERSPFPDTDLKSELLTKRKYRKLTQEIEKLLKNENEEDINVHMKEIFKQLDDLHDITITNKQQLKKYLIGITSVILWFIYFLLIKLTNVLKHRHTKKAVYNLSWLIFKLTVLWIEIIKTFSQTNIGQIILIFTFCSFYSTRYGQFCTNVFLDFLSTVFPNMGFITIKHTLINVRGIPYRTAQLFGKMLENIDNINTKTAEVYAVGTHIVSQVTNVTESVGKVKDVVTVGIAGLAAQQIAQNINIDQLMKMTEKSDPNRMLEKIFNKLVDLQEGNVDIKEIIGDLTKKVGDLTEQVGDLTYKNEQMHAILNNKVEQVLEKSIDTHIKLIEMNEYRSQEDRIINDLLIQTIDNTKNLPKLLPDIEQLIKANEKTNGELFETIIKAVKNGNSIESTLTTFLSNHALVKGIEIGTPLIKYLSDFTGIGMQSVLLPDTRKRVGLGGKRKQTRKKRHGNYHTHTRYKRFNKRK